MTEKQIDIARLAQALLDALDRHEDAVDPIHGDAYHPDTQGAVYEAKAHLRDAFFYRNGAP